MSGSYRPATCDTCAMRWVTGTNSTGFYNSIEDLIFIHGHNGATRVEWTGWTPVEQINSLGTAHKYKEEIK